MLHASVVLLFLTPALLAYYTGDQVESFDVSSYATCTGNYCGSTGLCYGHSKDYVCLCDNGRYSINATCKCNTHGRCGNGKCHDIDFLPDKYLCICPNGERYRSACGNTICERRSWELCKTGKCVNADNEGDYICQCRDGSCGKSCNDSLVFMQLRWNDKCLTDRTSRLCPPYFNRNWADYERGFEKTDQSGYAYWLGLKELSEITAKGRFNLILEVEHNDTYNNGRTQRQGVFQARYYNAKIAPASQKYRLSFSSFDRSSSMNDTLQYSQNINGMYFSTYDRNNNRYNGECPRSLNFGFWFRSCTTFYAMSPKYKYYQTSQFTTVITVKRIRMLLELAD